MSAALHRPMTVDEFLAWERAQELRYEFDGVQPIPMTGGTVGHSRIIINLITLLDLGLGPQWEVLDGNVQVRIGDRVRYPDVIVTGTAVPNAERSVADPVVLFEVASETTAHIDRTAKAAEYRETGLLRHYVMLEQAAAQATTLSRAGDGWSELSTAGLDAMLALPGIGLELPMRAVYRRVVGAGQ